MKYTSINTILTINIFQGNSYILYKMTSLLLKQQLAAYQSEFTPHEGIREMCIIPRNGNEINVTSLMQIEVNIVQGIKSTIWNNSITTD
jgi:hypothetical protein